MGRARRRDRTRGFCPQNRVQVLQCRPGQSLGRLGLLWVQRRQQPGRARPRGSHRSLWKCCCQAGLMGVAGRGHSGELATLRVEETKWSQEHGLCK